MPTTLGLRRDEAGPASRRRRASTTAFSLAGHVAVLGLVLAESMLLVVLGGALGLGLASAIVPGLAKASGGIVALQGVPGETWAMGLALMAAIGVAVGLLPALRARGLKIVDALAGR